MDIQEYMEFKKTSNKIERLARELGAEVSL